MSKASDQKAADQKAAHEAHENDPSVAPGVEVDDAPEEPTDPDQVGPQTVTHVEAVAHVPGDSLTEKVGHAMRETLAVCVTARERDVVTALVYQLVTVLDLDRVEVLDVAGVAHEVVPGGQNS